MTKRSRLPRRQTWPRVAAAALSAAALLGACSSGDGHGSGMSDHMGGNGANSPVVEGAREVEVSARSFAFDPAELRVAVGEDVTIVLTSRDTLHDFVVDELDAHVVANRGQTASGGLRAEEPGEYEYYCSVPGHRGAGMVGVLVVE